MCYFSAIGENSQDKIATALRGSLRQARPGTYFGDNTEQEANPSYFGHSFSIALPYPVLTGQLRV